MADTGGSGAMSMANGKAHIGDALAAAGLGVLIGILVGLSASTVVGKAIGSLIGLVVTLVTFRDQQHWTAGEAAAPPRRTYWHLTSSFAFACVAGVVVGMTLRTRNLFTPPLT